MQTAMSWLRNALVVFAVAAIAAFASFGQRNSVIVKKVATQEDLAKTKTASAGKKNWVGVHPIQKEKKWVFYNGTKNPMKDHPYSIREKGDEPFKWFYKRSIMKKHEVPLEKRVCFVHVGKTAGSTIACMMGFKTPTCRNHIIIPGGKMPIYTTNLFHNHVNDCYDDMSYYIMALRNPLHRIQSWFTYERMRDEQEHNKYRKPLFRDCAYKTLNEMAELGLAENGTQTDVCKDHAHMAIRAVRRYARHNFYNYEYYRHHIPPEAKILVIRTEALREDWTSAEAVIGDRITLRKGVFDHKNRSPKSDADKHLSPLSQKLLCEGMCFDIQAYKKILYEAINLSSADVEDALDDLESVCPIEAKLTECPTASD